MKALCLAAITLLLLSCSKLAEKSKTTSAEQIVDLAIKLHDSTEIEIKNLYKYTDNIPYEDTAHFAHILRDKGFKQTHYGQGNHYLGPRMMDQSLQKGDCECNVTKVYYNTLDTTQYQPTETIECHILKK
ncbi:hypothetical protein ACLI1A_10510 [Flavobacterium sp. RHBU_3]|uniref:hypothetical protein n=1 Tax=Flavobacterium sp. RHBU_3 TaxID=3391184 RepID=UPI0039852D0A